MGRNPEQEDSVSTHTPRELLVHPPPLGSLVEIQGHVFFLISLMKKRFLDRQRN